MNDDLFERIKEIFGDNEHLFAKLHRVAKEYLMIDFDESGLYEEDAERAHRHWKKLTAKLSEALCERLENTAVSIRENPDPGSFRVTFLIAPEGDEPCRLDVDYSLEGQISITRNA